jgi:THO complex subunit 4
MKASSLYHLIDAHANNHQIEVIVGAKDIPSPPAPKSLKDRVAHPKIADKDKPKPVTADKASASIGRGGRKRGSRGRGGATAAGGRTKPKTAEELDAEMADYWGTENGSGAGTADATMANGGAVQPAATNGETVMEDDVIA